MRQLDKPAQIDEELLRITAEVQETVDGLGEAIGKRAEQLRTLIAEADTKIEQLHAAQTRPAASPETPPAPALLVDGGPGGDAPGRAGGAKPEMTARGSGGAQRPPAAPEPTPLPAGRASAADVLRLAAEGHDTETIARLTNRGREEVRLLLGTRH